MRRLYDYKYKQSGLALLVDNEEFVESDKTVYKVSDGRRSVISVRLLGIRDTKDKLTLRKHKQHCFLNGYGYRYKKFISLSIININLKVHQSNPFNAIDLRRLVHENVKIGNK